MNWKDHFDKLGVIGSFLAAACCLGLPAMVAVFTALGLGFLINDSVLLPLLIAFLALTLYGLFRGYQRHRKRWPLGMGLASSVALFVFLFVAFSAPLAYASIAGLVLASVLNIVAQRLAHAGWPGGESQ